MRRGSKAEPKSTNGAHETMLTAGQAAERLGMSVRAFRKLRARRGTIDGSRIIKGEWAFPATSVEVLASEVADDGELTMEDASEVLLRELLNASKELHVHVARALKEVQEANAAAMTAAVETIKGTDARTKLLVDEIARQGQVNADSQKQTLETFALMKELIIGMAEVEATRIKAEADQTIRVERTKVAAHGMRLLAPVVKAGMARALRAPAIERDAQSETLLQLFRSMTEEKRAKLVGVLDEQQREAFETLTMYAVAHETIGESLKTLKDRMTPEQAAALSGVLSQNEMGAVMSLFDGEDNEATEQQKKPESAPQEQPMG